MGALDEEGWRGEGSAKDNIRDRYSDILRTNRRLCAAAQEVRAEVRVSLLDKRATTGCTGQGAASLAAGAR